MEPRASKRKPGGLRASGQNAGGVAKFTKSSVSLSVEVYKVDVILLSLEVYIVLLSGPPKFGGLHRFTSFY